MCIVDFDNGQVLTASDSLFCMSSKADNKFETPAGIGTLMMSFAGGNSDRAEDSPFATASRGQ